jgi:hypothetical protein
MAKTYSPDAVVPAAVVVYAGNKSPYQHILFTTKYDVKGYYTILKAEGPNINLTPAQIKNAQDLKTQDTVLEWAIKSISIDLVRDWSVSTAMITLTCPLKDSLTPIPPLPNLKEIRGGNYPYLTVEDEIRVYMGYIDSPTTPITADMLDDYPVEPFQATGEMKHNPSKPFAPVFWGFIDKLDLLADARGGVQYVISCRDRGRVFQDTKIISIPELAGPSNKDKNAGTGVAEGRRDKILIQVAKAATGDVPTADQTEPTCWKPILGAEEEPLAQSFTAYPTDNNNRVSFTQEDAAEDPAKWMRFATHKVMDYLSRPRFHTWVQRPPLVKSQGGGSVFQILNRSPLEIIQFLAATEERPIDFFTSHVNGDFVFGPRVLDNSGFKDKLRSYRTYFFKDWPRDKAPPSVNQQIISMRATTSTLATYNRFVVIDSNTNGANAATMAENIQVSLETLPWILSGDDRKIKPPCRNMIVFDGALSTYKSAAGGALIVGLSAARIWARDITAVQMTVMGDPTWYPSEAVRIYNSVLHDTHTLVDPGTDKSIKSKEEAIDEFNSSYSEGKPPGTPKGGSPITEQSELAQSTIRTSTIETNKDKLILPVYKVRSIKHKIITQGKSAGYTSEVAMVSDF